MLQQTYASTKSANRRVAGGTRGFTSSSPHMTRHVSGGGGVVDPPAEGSTAVGGGVSAASGVDSPDPDPPRHSIFGRGASFFARYNPQALHRLPPPTRSFRQNGVRVHPQFTHVLISSTTPLRFPRFACVPSSSPRDPLSNASRSRPSSRRPRRRSQRKSASWHPYPRRRRRRSASEDRWRRSWEARSHPTRARRR